MYFFPNLKQKQFIGSQCWEVKQAIPECPWAVSGGRGHGVPWGGCHTGGAGDRKWTSGCVVAERPGNVYGQSLSSTPEPEEGNPMHGTQSLKCLETD